VEVTSTKTIVLFSPFRGKRRRAKGGIGDSMVMLSFIEYYLNIRSICLHC
jgi:hypothetical protein